MEDLFTRIWENLADRIGGPMSFRLIMQPLVAAFFAVRAAMSDARLGNPAYLWTLISDSDARRGLLREGWTSIGKVFIMAVVIDAIYQFVVQRWVYPFETVIVAFILAVVPYVLIRGPLNRLVRRFWGAEREV